MTHKELEKELRIKYGMHKGSLSDPFELIDLVVEYNSLSDEDKNKAVELADEIYFGHGLEDYREER